MTRDRDAEIRAVAEQINGLLGELTDTVAALNSILTVSEKPVTDEEMSQ